MRISIVLPATDETTSLKETVRVAEMQLSGNDVHYIVVTSPKLTTKECRDAIAELQAHYGARIETFDQKLPGVGGALQEAFARASGEATVLMSSDMETDPAVLSAMLQKFQEGYDIVATTRWQSGAGFKGYNPVKLVFNFFFQQLFRLLYWTSLSDLTYAYRMYRTHILKEVRWEEKGFPFLLESLIKPLRLGYRAAEVKAPWVVRPEGRSHNSFSQTLDYFRVGVRTRFQSRDKIRYTAPQ